MVKERGWPVPDKGLPRLYQALKSSENWTWYVFPVTDCQLSENKSLISARIVVWIRNGVWRNEAVRLSWNPARKARAFKGVLPLMEMGPE